MGYYLLDHPNPRGERFYRSRRNPVLAVVVHITAGLEDLDGVDDLSAEQTAAYAASTERPVSWHSGSDTDTALELLPPSYTAWHCQGYNSCTVGHEISKRTPDWSGMDPVWIDRTLRRAAGHLGPIAHALGVPIRKASRGELDHALGRGGPPVGFIGHWELDPGRRADPGRVGLVDTFPWARFLALMTEGDDDMPAPDAVMATLDVPGGTPSVDRWLLTFDGGVRTEGDAEFYGSYPGLPPEQKVADPAGFRTIAPWGVGYAITDEKGRTYRFPGDYVPAAPTPAAHVGEFDVDALADAVADRLTVTRRP